MAPPFLQSVQLYFSHAEPCFGVNSLCLQAVLFHCTRKTAAFYAVSGLFQDVSPYIFKYKHV